MSAYHPHPPLQFHHGHAERLGRDHLSTAHPASRSNATATAAARSDPHLPGPLHQPRPCDQQARHTESRMRGQLARTVREGGQRKRTTSSPGTAPLADPRAARPGRIDPASYGRVRTSTNAEPQHREPGDTTSGSRDGDARGTQQPLRPPVTVRNCQSLR